MTKLGDSLADFIRGIASRIEYEQTSTPNMDHPSDRQEIATPESILARSTGVPERFQGADLSKLLKRKGNEEALAVAIAFQGHQPKRRGLMLMGPTGTGKTTIASAIALAWGRRRLKVRFRTMTGLLTEIKATFDDGASQTEQGLMREIACQDLFVLDDLGAERDTEWSKKVVVQLFEVLYNKGTTVIVTTNLGQQSLLTAYEQRVASRMIEMMQPVSVTGDDFRVRVTKKN